MRPFPGPPPGASCSCRCYRATGATLALAADILANLWPIPLPVGSTLALIGIPLILIILLRQRHA